MARVERVPSEDTAWHLVRRAQELGVLETNEPDELRAELAAFLAPIEAARSLPPEDGRKELIEELGELLIDSPHVEEVFADDAMLHRVIAAALLDFARALARAAREPDAALLAALAPRPAERVTLAQEGFVFPLFEGTRADAILDRGGPCKACKVVVPVRFEAHCHGCFREGLAMATRDTEHGMVRPEDAEEGLTHGAYADPADVVGLDVVLTEQDEDGSWYRFRFAKEGLAELIRTPDYQAAQGSSWLFCCGRPMIFLGAVDEALLFELTDGKTQTSAELLGAMLGQDDDEAEDTLDEVLGGRLTVHAFRCSSCGKRRANTDRT